MEKDQKIGNKNNLAIQGEKVLEFPNEYLLGLTYLGYPTKFLELPPWKANQTTFYLLLEKVCLKHLSFAC